AAPGERRQPLVPRAVAIEAFLRRLAEDALLVARRLDVGIAVDHAQLGEEHSRRARLDGGNPHVVRSPGIAAHRVLAPGRVAARAILELEDLEIRIARAREP